MASTRYPSFETLLSAAESPDLPAALRSHLEEERCSACEGRLRLVRDLLRMLPHLALEPAPEAAVRSAIELSRQAPSRTGVRALLGRLVSAGASGPVPAFRGGGSASRHRLYRAGPYDVDVALLANGALVGQVLPAEAEVPGLDEGHCILYGGSRPVEYELRGGGDFRFDSVGPGIFALVIESDTTRLVVPDIAFQAGTSDPRAEEPGDTPIGG